PGFTVAQIAGVSVFFSVTALLMLNFHHSHIWVRYGRVMEHVFISPAQHQIHHSVEPRHFNKNFGQFLAIWDWMFGTLYIPEGREDIRIGLDAPEDAPLMTHSLWTALWNPLQRMWRIATRRA
ncbi:MAG: sterol desaturase family protein, partial [Pseudomonadota bacterium]